MIKGDFKSALALGLILLSLCFALSGMAEEGAKDLALCKQCNMKIEESQKRFSVVDAKSPEKAAFDDIGCALLWREDLCASKLMRFESNAEVFDYYTAEPVIIEDAYFVIDSGVKTPMEYGIIAFKNKQGAERFVAETGKGKVVTYGKLPVPKVK